MKIIAYTGNLYFDSFQMHVAEMKAKSFDTILFAITESDLLFNLETFQEFRQYAAEQGMTCWCTYWGLFAGEAVSTAKDNTAKVVSLLVWIDEVKKIGFKNVMVDEPKLIPVSLLMERLKKEHTDLNFHLCLADDVFMRMSDKDIKKMPVKSIGLSCYHLGHTDWVKVTDRTFEWCSRLQRLRPDDNFVFIQAFDIPEGMETLPLIVRELAEIKGIKNFAVWSFRATEATASKRPKHFKKIWDSIDF